MAYITITESHVKDCLAAPEYTALLNAAKSLDQTPEQILAAAVRSITTRVRGAVSGCKTNVLGPLGTIPDELEEAAIALIRRRLFTRLPNMARLFDPVRQQEATDAIELLKETAACRFGIVPPEAPAEEQAAGPGVQLISSRKRIAKREQTAGL